MKNKILTIFLTMSLVSLTGCLKGCDKDHEEKKEEKAKEEKTSTEEDKKEEKEQKEEDKKAENLEKNLEKTASLDSANQLQFEQTAPKSLNSANLEKDLENALQEELKKIQSQAQTPSQKTANQQTAEADLAVLMQQLGQSSPTSQPGSNFPYNSEQLQGYI